MGLEPTRPFTGPWILNPMRLPFRHSGNFKQECIPTASGWVVAQYYPCHELLTELFSPKRVGGLVFRIATLFDKEKALVASATIATLHSSFL